MNNGEQASSAPSEGEPSPSPKTISRREVLQKGILLALGTGVALKGLKAEAAESRKLKEATLQDLIITLNVIEENPKRFRKSCDMESGGAVETGACSGSEVDDPFSVKRFIIQIFDLDKGGKIALSVMKSGEAIEITTYGFDGKEHAKSTINKDGTSTSSSLESLDLPRFIKALQKIESR